MTFTQKKLYTFVLTLILIITCGITLQRHWQDFTVFYGVGSLALQKVDIYSQYFNGMTVYYLPYFSLIMMIFAVLPYGLAGPIWTFSKVFFYVFIYWKFLGREAKGSSGKVPKQKHTKALLLCSLLPFVIFFNSIINEFRLGQVNAYILFFLFLCFTNFNEKKEWRSAFYFSISAIKVMPLGMLFLFFIKRQWSFLFKIGVVFCGWFLALIAWFGWTKCILICKEMYLLSHSNKLNFEQITLFENQSIHSFFGRIAKHLYPSLANSVSTSVSLPWFELIAYLCLLLLLIPIFLVRAQTNKNKLSLYEYGLMLTWCVLASPDSRRYHMVLMILPVYGIVKYLIESNYKDTFCKIVLCVLFVLFVPLNRDLLGITTYNLLREFSVQMYGIVLVYIALIKILKIENLKLNPITS